MKFNIINIMYIALTLFAVKQLYDIYQTRKRIGEVVTTFTQRPKILMVILVGLLFPFGVLSFFSESKMIGLMVVFIGFIFGYMAIEKIVFSKNGIYFNGKMVLWNDLKQWKFDKDNKSLHLILKNQRAGDRIIPVRPEDHERLQATIRQFKRKK